MNTSYRNNSHFQRLLLVTLGFLCSFVIVAKAQTPTNHPKIIGRFELGGIKGHVIEQQSENELQVQVGIIAGTTNKTTALVEKVSVWVLLDHEKTLRLRKKLPASGKRPVEFENAGSSTAYIVFFFDRTKADQPIAIVLKCGDNYQVFRMPEKAN